MKKLLMLCASLALFGCSDDDSNSTNNSSSINPPAWVRGTWTYTAFNTTSGLKFTSDDICTIGNNTTACNKETIALIESGSGFTEVVENVTDSEYTVDITIQSSTTTYHVEKISSTQIKWFLNSSTTLTLTKQ